MKNVLIVLNVLLLLAVGFFVYISFSKSSPQTTVIPDGKGTTTQVGDNKPFTLAYFEMDSIEKKYTYVIDGLAQLRTKENSIKNELQGLENAYKKRLAQLNEKGPSMTQTEGEAAQREMFEMEQNYQRRKQVLEQEFMNQNEKLKTAIKKEIEAFLSTYNATHGYTYIMANEPGLFFLKDKSFDITNDVVDGLNAIYKKGN